jgi:DNA-binding CsgD family transcriptional regulator
MNPNNGDLHNGTSRWNDLTARELAVASLVGRAMTNQQIARRLEISSHTVNFHLRQVFRKLDIRSRVELALLARALEGTGDPADFA